MAYLCTIHDCNNLAIFDLNICESHLAVKSAMNMGTPEKLGCYNCGKVLPTMIEFCEHIPCKEE